MFSALLTTEERVPKQQEDHLAELVNNCLVFADRKGEIKEKDSHPFSSWLAMEYKDEDLSIYFRVQSSPYSNGSSFVKIEQNKTIVLEASGSFTVAAFNISAKTYIPGEWEKKINEFAAKVLRE